MLTASRGARAWGAGLLFALLVSACQGPSGKPDEADFQRGRNALSMSRYDWARHYFAADLERYPDRPESLRGLGIGWVSGFEGSLTKGVDAFERYLELHPDDRDIRLRLARALSMTGDAEGALGAIESLSADSATEKMKARALLSRDPEAALEHLDATDVEDFETQLLAARAYDRLGRDEEALAATADAAAANPLSAEIHYLQSQLFRRLGRADEAAQALDLHELIAPLNRPGVVMPPARELAVLRRVIERLETTPLVVEQHLARLLLETGGVTEAAPLLAKITADPASSDDALLVIAQAAHAQSQLGVARDLYRIVLERSPRNVKALASQARLAYESNDFETARELLLRGFAEDPHHAPLHFTQGLLALNEGDDAQALDSLKTAVDLVPWLPRFRLTLADVYLTRGDFEQLEFLLDEAPADPAIDAFRQKHSLTRQATP